MKYILFLIKFLNAKARSYLPLVWLTLLGILLMTRIVFIQDKTILAGFDNSVQFYSWYTYATNSLAEGSLPLWDPHQFSGHSFIGEMQTGLFYPLNLIMFITLTWLNPDAYHASAPIIIEGFALIGLIICSFSSYWMFREFNLEKPASLVGATVFAYAGFVFNRQVGQLCIFNSIVWIPFVLAAYLRHEKPLGRLKKLFWLQTSGLGLGLCILSGHYLGFIYSGFILLFYSAFKIAIIIIQNHIAFSLKSIQLILKNALALTIAFLFGLIISSIQLLPTIEYSKLALRWVNAPNPVRSGESIPYDVIAENFRYSIGGLFSFFNPDFQALNTITIDGWLYSGIIPLFLSILAIWKLGKKKPEVIFFACLMFVSIFYSLGGDSILHLGYNILPFSDPIRSASRISCITHFSIACLAAFCLDSLFKNFNRNILVSICASTVKVNLILIAILALGSLTIDLVNRSIATSLMVTSILLILTAILISFCLQSNKNSWQKYSWFLALSLSILIVQDTYYFQVKRLPSRDYSPPGLLYPSAVIDAYDSNFETLNKVKTQYRIANLNVTQNATGTKNFGDIFGINMTMGHGASMPENYFTFLGELGWDNQRINDLLSAKYILKVEDKDDQTLLKFKENPSALPIFRLADQYEIIPERSKARNLLKQENFDYRSTIILDREPNFPSPLSSDLEIKNNIIKIDKYQPNQVSLLVTSKTPKILVFADQYYPGWIAYVNGSKSKIMMANTVFKAVAIPSGKSQIEFKYQPISFYMGAIFTFIASLLYILIGFIIYVLLS